MERRQAARLLSVLQRLEEQRRGDLARSERRLQLGKEERAALLESHTRLSEARLGFMTNLGARLQRNAAEQSHHARDIAKFQSELRRLALISKGVARDMAETLRRGEERDLADLLEDWTGRQAAAGA
jgi:hypothetical protein